MNLGKDIRKRVRHGTQMPAVVIDTVGSSASARLSANGAIYRNLSVVGGPAQIGDPCYVDLTTPKPTIVMVSKSWLTEDDLNRALRRLQFGLGTGFDIDRIWVFSPGAGATPYSRDASGLYDAFQGAGTGSKVVAPGGEISGNFEIPEGVEFVGLGRERTRIFGTVTGNDGASMEQVFVQSSSAYAVVGPSSGLFNVYACVISACQGTGFHQPAGGASFVQYSSLIGEGGYAAKNDGSLKVHHSGVYGLTDWFDGNVDVYDITEISPICEILVSLWRNYRPNGNLSAPIFGIEPQNGFTAVDNIGSNLVRAKVLSAAPPQAVVSSNNYIYWIDPTTTDGIGEYELATDTVTHVFTIASGTIRQISLVEERKVAVVVYTTSYDYEVRLYDFETETYDVLFTRLGTVIEGGATNAYVLMALVSVDDLTLAVSRKLKYPDSPPDYVTPYGVVDVYNHTTTERDTYEIMGVTREDVDGYGATVMADAPTIVNGKLIFSFDLSGMEIYGTSTDICEAPYFIFDISSRVLSVAIDVAPGYGNQKNFQMAGHNDLNRVYLLAEGHSGSLFLDHGYLDLSTGTFTWSGGVGFTATGGFIQGADKCYFYKMTGTSSFILYEVTDIATGILSLNPGTSLTKFDQLCSNVDEVNNRIWFYRSATELRGYDITAGTYIDLSTGVPAPVATPNRSYLVLQGDKMLISVYRSASNTVSLYVVRNQESP